MKKNLVIVTTAVLVLGFGAIVNNTRVQRLESRISNLQSQVLKLHAESAANKFVIQALHPDDVKFPDPK